MKTFTVTATVRMTGRSAGQPDHQGCPLSAVGRYPLDRGRSADLERYSQPGVCRYGAPFGAAL